MSLGKTLLGASAVAALLLLAPLAGAQTISAPYNSVYSFVDLGSAPGVPGPYGGLTFKLNDPNTLLLGGAANTAGGVIDQIAVTRGPTNHVTGFSGTATQVSTAPGQTGGGIDGGLIYGPNGTLLYTGYSDNSLGQVKPGSTTPDKFVDLDPLGIASSVGWLGLVPAGFGGAGHLKILSYNTGRWYDAQLTPDASGTYDITGVSSSFVQLDNGPEGAIYVAAGQPLFPVNSILLCNYQQGQIYAYQVDANGDPILATKTTFMTGLTGAEGAAIDPLTGDFFFSTFGGGNRVIEVNGFLAPEPTLLTPLALAAVAFVRRQRR
jgi:hypothetical protein